MPSCYIRTNAMLGTQRASKTPVCENVSTCLHGSTSRVPSERQLLMAYANLPRGASGLTPSAVLLDRSSLVSSFATRPTNGCMLLHSLDWTRRRSCSHRLESPDGNEPR